MFSAHGVAPVVHEEAAARQLRTIDATCPLVTKVHKEAVRFADEDYDILLIGHEGHEEVMGTSGEAPDHITPGRRPGRRRERQVRDPEQGRLAVADHAVGRRDDGDGRRLRERFPAAARPAERRHLLRHAEPSGRGEGDGRRVPTWSSSSARRNSSNSVRLVEVALEPARAAGHLVDRPTRSTRPGSTASRRSA